MVRLAMQNHDVRQKSALVAAAALALCGCARPTAPTPEAAKIIGAAEQIAAYPDLADPEKLQTEFGMSLRQNVRTRRPSSCPGRPIQLSEGWQSTPSASWWFDQGDAPPPRQKFLLQVEDQPPVCPSDPISYRAEAVFLNIALWHCVTLADLGDLQTRFETTYHGAGAHILAEDVARPNGGKARLEIDFGGGDPGACLHAIFIKVGNGQPSS
jgi:hypothetical protein